MHSSLLYSALFPEKPGTGISEAKTAIAEIEWELEYERYRAEKDAMDGFIDVHIHSSLYTA